MGYKSKKSLSILQIFGYMLEHLEAIEKLFGNFFKIFISGKKLVTRKPKKKKITYF
jgi:hypothetical protein